MALLFWAKRSINTFVEFLQINFSETPKCNTHKIFISGTLHELAVDLFGEPCATQIRKPLNLS